MQDLISPPKAVTLVGRHYSRRGAQLFTACPCCDQELYIIGPSFVCENTGCDFSRGGAIDYMAQVLGSYKHAVELASGEAPYYKDRVTEEALQKLEDRKLIRFAIEAERNNTEPDIERLALKRDFLTHLSIDPEAFSRGHWFLSSKQSNDLLLLLASRGCDIPSNLQSRPTAIAPFWGNHHSISALYVVSDKMNCIKICGIEPFKQAWFGLSQLHPACHNLAVFDTYKESMRKFEYYLTHDVDTFPSSLHVDTRAGMTGWTPQSIRYHSSDKAWLQALVRWSYTENFDDAVFADEEYGHLSISALLEILMLRCRDEFKPFTDMCAAMRLGAQARSKLMFLSHQMPDQNLAELLRQTLTRKLLDHDDKGSVYECASGYEVETGTQKKMATNFILSFDSITSFSAMSDLLYSGRIFLGELAIPFDIPSLKLDNPTQVSAVLQNAQLQRPGSHSNEELALIKNPKEFKRVMEVLKNRCATLPRNIGIRNLGWSRKFDQFLTPVAVLDREGLRDDVRYHADESGTHHCYRSGGGAPAEPGHMPEVSPWLAECVSAMVAQTVRFYHSKPANLWRIMNNSTTRPKALRLFSGLGQYEPLRLSNGNIYKKNIDLNMGMPCLVAGLNELQANQLNIAGLLLADNGTDFTNIPDSQIEEMAVTFPALLLDICRRLLENPESVSYREKRSVRPMAAMAEEGAALIMEDYWAEWPVAGSQWATLNRLLEDKELEIPNVVQVEVDSNTLLFPNILWQGTELDPTDIALEMGLLNLKATVIEEGIRVDRNMMNQAFTNFYGKVPELIAI